MFKIDKIYKRSHLHDQYGGNRQGGIANCAKHPFIFIFTGKTGEQYGYEDGWDEDNFFHYTGEGQKGDMTFTKGNMAILKHQENEKQVFLLIIVLPMILFSQGIYLNKGQSGFGATAGFGTNEDLNLLIGGIGYSYSGIFDVGLSYGRAISKDEPKMTLNSFMPSVDIHLIKQNESLPISLAVNGIYSIGNTKSDLFDLYDVTVTNSGYSVGGYVYSEIVLGGFSIIPMLGFSYQSVTVKMEDDFGSSIEEDDTNSVFDFSLPFVFQINNNKLSLSPGISIDENSTSFALSLNLIIPTIK